MDDKDKIGHVTERGSILISSWSAYDWTTNLIMLKLFTVSPSDINDLYEEEG